MAMAVVAAGLTSCEKSETKTLKITTKALRPADKATMSGTTIMWQNEDVIKINGVPETVAISGSNYSVPAPEAEPDGNYYAAFPSNISYSYNGGNPYFICNLSQLSYTDTSVSVPMFACTNGGNNLTFSTPYALLALNITNSTDDVVTSIPLTITLSGSTIGVQREVTFSRSTPVTDNPPSGADQFLASISCSIPINSQKIIYIPIPASSGSYMEFDFGGLCKRRASREFTFSGGYIYSINLDYEIGANIE